MKKAQIEIVGLLIVVILIVLGGIFYLKFAVLNKKPVEQTSRQNIQATNLINALMNIRLCDNKFTMKESLILCGNKELLCDEDACNYIKDQLKLIDDNIDYKHSFYVKKDQDKIINIEGCEEGIASPASSFSDKGTYYEAYLLLCSK